MKRILFGVLLSVLFLSHTAKAGDSTDAEKLFSCIRHHSCASAQWLSDQKIAVFDSTGRYRYSILAFTKDSVNYLGWHGVIRDTENDYVEFEFTDRALIDSVYAGVVMHDPSDSLKEIGGKIYRCKGHESGATGLVWKMFWKNQYVMSRKVSKRVL